MPHPANLGDTTLATGLRAADRMLDETVGASGGKMTESAAVRTLIEELTLHERVRSAVREQAEARLVYQGAKVAYDREYYVAHTAHVEARRYFAATMGKVYRDPADAVRRFEMDAQQRSTREAIQTLYTSPEAYGHLHRRPEQYAFGLLRRTNDSVARHEAHNAAIVAITVERRWRDTLEVPTVTPGLHDAQERLAAAAGRVQGLPSLTRIERGIQQAVIRLLPEEMRALQRMATEPQRAVLKAMTQKVKEIALGRDGQER